MKRFIILTPEPTAPEVQGIADLIVQRGATFWHFLTGSWLIMDPQDRRPDWWREAILEKANRSGLVIEFDLAADWAGRLPNAAWEWLRTSWDPAVKVEDLPSPPALTKGPD
jgi:hypothetical protein